MDISKLVSVCRNLAITLVLTLSSALSITTVFAAAPNYDLVREAGDVIGSVTYCGEVYKDLYIYIPGTSFSARSGNGGIFKMSYVQEGTYNIVFKLKNIEIGKKQNVQVIAKQTTDIGALEFCVDHDNDGFNPPADCNDENPNINPAQNEICGDGIDNNCNTAADENCSVCLDLDNDGYFGQPDCGTEVDCNDINAAVNPLAQEVCDDGIDNNCNGVDNESPASNPSEYFLDADGDGFGVSDVSMFACSPDPGYVPFSGDCDDSLPSIHPAQPDICDSIDNDCDGKLDEDAPMNTYYQDLDGDNFGNPSVTTTACSSIAGYVLRNDDCNDSSSEINPQAQELCDGLDNNCNGNVDEDILKYVSHGTSKCTNGTWELVNCDQSYANCDGDDSNGCEIYLYSSLPHGTLTCQGLLCDNGYGNCDNDVTNGCETDLYNDNNNCGTCKNQCGLLDWCDSGQCELFGL